MQHGSEYGPFGALWRGDDQDGGADLGVDAVDAGVVGGAQGLIVVGGGAGLGEFDGKVAAVQCVADVADPCAFGAVGLGPQCVVEGAERGMPVLCLDGCGDAGGDSQVAVSVVFRVVVAVFVEH